MSELFSNFSRVKLTSKLASNYPQQITGLDFVDTTEIFENNTQPPDMISNFSIDITNYHSESHFIQLFRAGDERVFTCIYKQLYEPLTWSARNLVNSSVDAEDIAAAAFLKLFTHGRKEIDSLEYIRRWMFIVVRNDALNYLRRKTKTRTIHRDLAYICAIKYDVCFEKSEEYPYFHAVQALEKLPKQAKTVLKLYYLKEMKTRQIATLLNLSGQTVLNHKAKALNRLRQNFSFNGRKVSENL